MLIIQTFEIIKIAILINIRYLYQASTNYRCRYNGFVNFNHEMNLFTLLTLWRSIISILISLDRMTSFDKKYAEIT